MVTTYGNLSKDDFVAVRTKSHKSDQSSIHSSLQLTFLALSKRGFQVVKRYIVLSIICLNHATKLLVELFAEETFGGLELF